MITMRTKMINKVFDRCNLIGEECDVFKEMYRYSYFREMSDQDLDRAYDEIVDRLGFTN